MDGSDHVAVSNPPAVSNPHAISNPFPLTQCFDFINAFAIAFGVRVADATFSFSIHDFPFTDLLAAR